MLPPAPPARRLPPNPLLEAVLQLPSTLACAVRRVSAQAAPQGGRELVHWVQQNGGSVQGVAVQEWGGEGEAAGFGLRALQVRHLGRGWGVATRLLGMCGGGRGSVAEGVC